MPAERQRLRGRVQGHTLDDEFRRGVTAFGDVNRGAVRLVISDAHLGLQEAVRKVFVGSVWQRCRVHFMRNVLSRVSRRSQPIVAALVKTIFAQASKEEAEAAARATCELGQGWPRSRSVGTAVELETLRKR